MNKIKRVDLLINTQLISNKLKLKNTSPKINNIKKNKFLNAPNSFSTKFIILVVNLLVKTLFILDKVLKNEIIKNNPKNKKNKPSNKYIIAGSIKLM